MVNEQELRTEFEGSKDLQIEFGDDFRAYFALAKHEDEIAKRDERRARHRERKTETKVDEAALKAEFAASAALQSEFGSDVNLFLKFKEGEAENMVRTFENNCVGSASAPKAEETSAAGQKKTEKKISDR